MEKQASIFTQGSVITINETSNNEAGVGYVAVMNETSGGPTPIPTIIGSYNMDGTFKVTRVISGHQSYSIVP